MDIDKKIEAILARMSVREKAEAVTGKSMFKLPGCEELGIRDVYFLDGATGLNYMQMFTDCFYAANQTGKDGWAEMINDASGIAERMIRMQDLVLGIKTDVKEEEKEEYQLLKEKMESYAPGGELPGCFPPGILLGSGWDEESVYETGSAVGKEADFYGIDVLLGSPNVNLHRDPLAGRLFEGYSEDPYLCGKLAPEFVKGVQSQGIGANVKHFAANNQETNRRTVNEHIPERALREIYLEGFRKCIQDGGCKTVMSAYNLINGTPCSMNRRLLTDILRDEWGFDGFVVCDWGGAYKQCEALYAGNDVDMPGPRNVDSIVAAVEKGELSEEVLDISITRLWKTLLTIPCITEGHKQKHIDREYSKKSAYNSAKEGIILLKNENSVLPFSKTAHISFYGDKSKKLIESGGGSAGILTDQSTNVFDCAAAIAGKDRILFEEVNGDTEEIVVIVGAKGQEGFDRRSLDIDPADKKALEQAISDAKRIGKPVTVIINACGPVDIMPYIADIDALLCIFIPGMEGGRACADILFGDVVPSGKLPLTFPKKYTETPTSGNFPGWNEEVWYGEGIFVGYRYYDYHNVEPLYPFGYGLSYTTFEMTEACADKNMIETGNKDSIKISVKVKNTGKLKGKEVVQLYISQDEPAMVKPIRELKAFKKVELEPGEEKTVILELTEESFASYDTKSSSWVAEPGGYHIFIGNSSRNIMQTVEVKLTGFNPFGFNENTVMGDLASTKGAVDTFCEFCPPEKFSKEAIEWGILFQPSGSLRDYWEKRVYPELSGSEEEKVNIYKSMLKAMNQFK